MDAFGVTESVVGLTVLALATSAEMVALVLAAHRRGLTEIALAGAVGSVAYNATVSLGLAAWVDPLAIGRGSPVTTVALATAVLPLVLLAGRRTGWFPVHSASRWSPPTCSPPGGSSPAEPPAAGSRLHGQVERRGGGSPSTWSPAGSTRPRAGETPGGAAWLLLAGG